MRSCGAPDRPEHAGSSECVTYVPLAAPGTGPPRALAVATPSDPLVPGTLRTTGVRDIGGWLVLKSSPTGT